MGPCYARKLSSSFYERIHGMPHQVEEIDFAFFDYFRCNSGVIQMRPKTT